MRGIMNHRVAEQCCARSQPATGKCPASEEHASAKRATISSAPQVINKCRASGEPVLIKSIVQTTVRTAVNCSITKQCEQEASSESYKWTSGDQGGPTGINGTKG